MVVLLEASPGHEPVLGERALSTLRRLGITSVELLRDERTVGLVLEGWAFDPFGSGAAAAAAVAGAQAARTLHPIVQMAVAASPAERKQG